LRQLASSENDLDYKAGLVAWLATSFLTIVSVFCVVVITNLPLPGQFDGGCIFRPRLLTPHEIILGYCWLAFTPPCFGFGDKKQNSTGNPLRKKFLFTT